MADSRDITGKNRKFTGTTGVVLPKGTTAERADTESGEIRFNTQTELMEYYDGNQWKPIDAPPTISSVTTSDSTGDTTILNADGSTLYTITINGGNFSTNPTVKFIGSTGTEYAAGNVTRVSGSQITCTTLSNMGTSDDPYDVQVINTSGLSAILDDAFSYNAAPVFDTPSGQLGTVYDGQTISGSTFDASATDAEGNTITYSIISGSLPGSGLSFSSSTGLITGTLSGTPSLGNYPFVVRASTAEGVVERQFSIQVTAFPFITATGGTITTSGDYKIHTFTGGGCFVVSNAGSPAGSDTVDYLVVAGGGGAPGGGGGAGGFREGYNPGSYTASPLATTALPVSATTYPITVGGGGAGSPSTTDGPGASAGSPSVFSTITSAGGGAGAKWGNIDFPQAKNNGGSGGGGGQRASCGTGNGTGNTPPVSPPQGNNGGASAADGGCAGSAGGGGGAGGVGNAGVPGTSGTGGNGIATSISASPVTRAGGGGGGGRSPGSSGASGGPGGGGDGGTSGGGTSGGTNTGSGGGGGGFSPPGYQNGGSGGSGIVIIRYKFQ